MNKGEEIPSHEFLLRRCLREQIRPDGTVNPRAFRTREQDNGQLSVDVESLTTYERAIENSDIRRLARLPVGGTKELGLSCIYDPIEGVNTAHSYIEEIPYRDEAIPNLLSKIARKVEYP